MLNTLAHYIDVSPDDIQYIFSLPPDELYTNAVYQALVAGLDRNLLDETLPDTRALLDEHLPAFKALVADQYPDLPLDGVTSYALCNWLLGYLQSPNELSRLRDRHMHVPPRFIREFLPNLLEIMDALPVGKDVWQRALAVLAIPLVSSSQPIDRVE